MATAFSKWVKLFVDKYSIKIFGGDALKVGQLKAFLRRRKELESDETFISIKQYILTSSPCYLMAMRSHMIASLVIVLQI